MNAVRIEHVHLPSGLEEFVASAMQRDLGSNVTSSVQTEKPMLLGIGPGSSGTRSLFIALVQLGV